MGEIVDFIQLYVQDSGMIEDMLNEVALNLQGNIQDQLYPRHGWVTGNLHDSIQSNIASKTNSGGVVEAYTMVEYAPYVDEGHHSFPGYHFMEHGLEATVAMYR